MGFSRVSRMFAICFGSRLVSQTSQPERTRDMASAVPQLPAPITAIFFIVILPFCICLPAGKAGASHFFLNQLREMVLSSPRTSRPMFDRCLKITTAAMMQARMRKSGLKK